MGVNNMYKLESTEIGILRHLYELGIHDLHGGWEREFKLDKKAVDELYRAKLVDKSVPPIFIRLSERGVGTVLFGLQKAEMISEFL
jgi:hypothetical protein